MMSETLKSFLLALIIVVTVAQHNWSGVCAARCGCPMMLYQDKRMAATHHFRFTLGQSYARRLTESIHTSHPGHIGEGGHEHTTDRTTVVKVSYAASQSIIFNAETPFINRSIAIDGDAGSQTVRGLGDIEVSAQWSRDIFSDDATVWSLGLLGVVSLPSGQNAKTLTDGSRAAEHLQPGAGAFALQFGAALARLGKSVSSFVSIYYRVHGANDFGFKSGPATLFNTGLQYRVSEVCFTDVSLNGRSAERDIEDGTPARSTGGWVIFLSPGVSYNLSKAVGISAKVQFPVADGLNEMQSEKATIEAGLHYNLIP